MLLLVVLCRSFYGRVILCHTCMLYALYVEGLGFQLPRLLGYCGLVLL